MNINNYQMNCFLLDAFVEEIEKVFAKIFVEP